MDDKMRWQLRRVGIVMGAWLLGLYALVVESVNRLALPNVPLAEPSGGLFAYMIGYLLAGVVLGLVCCWPESTLIGAVAGGAAGSLIILALNWVGMLGTPAWMGGMTLVTLISFLPMALILSPAALLARFAANTFIMEPPHPLERVRFSRWWRPVIATALFFAFGLTALYPTNVRDALRQTSEAVQVGLTGDVPEMLQNVWQFPSGADGTYYLEYSDTWQNFIGQYASNLDILNAFLVRVRFSNGFTISCLFSPTTQPVCLNEEFPFGE